VVVKLFIGMAIALILNSRMPFRSVLTAIILLPWIVPEVVTALTWRSIYDPTFGGLNPMLEFLGVIDRPDAWLAEPNLAMPSVIAVNVWKGIPFFTILLLAGLKSIERTQYEAAEIDGANIVQRFRHITLPEMRYVIAITMLLSTIYTFNTFGLIYLMTGGGPGGGTRVYSILVYEKAIIGLRFGPGAATALSAAPLMAGLIFVLARIMRRDSVDSRQPSTGIFSTFLNTPLKPFGWVSGLIFDIAFWPFEMLMIGLAKVGKNLAAASGSPRMTRAQRESTAIGMRYLMLIPVLFFVLFPFFWMFATSFKTDLQVQQFRSMFWPDPWTTDQYRELIYDTNFLIWFRNTAVVASFSTFISVCSAAMAAYALTRLRFLGAGLLTSLLLVTYLLPAALLFIPLYRILVDLGIINSYWSLILTYPTFLMPFATWVMMGYFRSIPIELEEAAMIDGSTRLGAFRRITLPLATPGLLSVTLIAFTTAWNEFLFAFVFITSDKLKTLPVGLQLLVFGDIYPWGLLMAASLLMAIPVVVIYAYAQRFLVEGLTAGSVKG
jgi:multiple sugar transport system permease protein